RDRARHANRDSALRDAGNGDRLRQQTQRAGMAHREAAPVRPAGLNQGGMRHGGGLGGGGRPRGGEHFGHGRR
ncbi:DUF3300 domain-containing protein, partial [Cupriavidus taiwanensis]|nr:DUF3300 domain-containing protein [Cupriavidus taiwanensis]